MGTSKTPMQPAPSLRASTSMAVHPSIGASSGAPPSFTKYAKIQPAIAIKPKPLAPSPVSKAAFNPRYDPTASSLTLLHEEAINTLRKWILPPRPRPGRKPSTQPVPEERKTACKKKIKTRPAAANAVVAASTAVATAADASAVAGVGVSAPTPSAPPTLTPAAASLDSAASTTAVKSAGAVKSPAIGTAARVALSRLESADLHNTFLARLKEQELIRNYIEVLTNQIKELRFVQSGVITVDALDSSSRARRKIAVPQTVEQLDQINNIRDLDRFVAHLTTQLNVIHSVTKKLTSPAGLQVQLQIRHYLDLRAKHRGGRNGDAAASARGAMLTPESAPGPLLLLLLPLPAVTRASFTPSLLRPLRMNLFEEDDVIDVEILNDDLLLDDNDKHKREKENKDGKKSAKDDNRYRDDKTKDEKGTDDKNAMVNGVRAKDGADDKDFNEKDEHRLKQSFRLDPLALSKENLYLLGQGLLAERLKLEEAGMTDFLAAGETKERRLRKMVCGFCNTETPCLCFDADSIFGDQ